MYPERHWVDNLRNQRIHYIEGSGHKHQAQTLQSYSYMTIPSFVGQWFPRNDDMRERSLYCASMLGLLQPWRNLIGIAGDLFELSFEHWEKSTTKKNQDIMKNIQFDHEALQGAKRCRSELHHKAYSQLMDQMEEASLSQAQYSTVLMEENMEIARRQFLTSEGAQPWLIGLINCLQCRDIWRS